MVCQADDQSLLYCTQSRILRLATRSLVHNLENSFERLSSGFFLSGPCKQLKNMFAEKRIVATAIYLAFLILTLVAAFRQVMGNALGALGIPVVERV